MKKLLIITLAFFTSCATPQFLVVSKQPGVLEENCIITIKPINVSARMKGKINQAIVGCGDYEVGDTLFLSKEEFTNF